MSDLRVLDVYSATLEFDGYFAILGDIKSRMSTAVYSVLQNE